MQSKKQLKMKVPGPKYVLHVPFYLLLCMAAQSFADPLPAGRRTGLPSLVPQSASTQRSWTCRWPISITQQATLRSGRHGGRWLRCCTCDVSPRPAEAEDGSPAVFLGPAACPQWCPPSFPCSREPPRCRVAMQQLGWRASRHSAVRVSVRTVENARLT